MERDWFTQTLLLFIRKVIMEKDWITGSDGENLKFKRETLLNYGMNRWVSIKLIVSDQLPNL